MPTIQPGNPQQGAQLQFLQMLQQQAAQFAVVGSEGPLELGHLALHGSVGIFREFHALAVREAPPVAASDDARHRSRNDQRLWHQSRDIYFKPAEWLAQPHPVF